MKVCLKNKLRKMETNKKHNILIDAKWHRICITPAVIIIKSQTDYFIDKLTEEFKILSEKFQ